MKYIYGLVAIVLCVPLVVSADTVIRSGSVVSVGADQMVAGNFYGFGNTVSLSGTSTADVVVAGGAVTLNGEVGHDVLGVGGTVSIHGEVGDDVRVVGGEVTIAGTVTGSVTVIAGRVKIMSTADIGKDVIIYAGEATVDGTVAGSITGQIGTLRINGAVAESVDVAVRTVTLGERADIAGDFVYASTEDVIRAQSAVVAGSVVKNAPRQAGSQSQAAKTAAMWFLMMTFATLLLYLVARRHVLSLSHTVKVTAAWKLALVGFATFVLLPLAASILAASALGIIAGIILIAGFVLLFALALPCMVIVAGSLMVHYFKMTSTPFLIVLLLGAVMVGISLVIPVVGWLFFVTFYMMAAGSIVLKVYKSL